MFPCPTIGRSKDHHQDDLIPLKPEFDKLDQIYWTQEQALNFTDEKGDADKEITTCFLVSQQKYKKCSSAIRTTIKVCNTPMSALDGLFA